MKRPEGKRQMGVTQIPNGRWIARINANGEGAYLGCFSKYDDAVAARKKAEEIVKKHYPEWTPGSRRDNKSGTTGISHCPRSNSWRVVIKGKYVGSFKNITDAEIARTKFLAKHPELT